MQRAPQVLLLTGGIAMLLSACRKDMPGDPGIAALAAPTPFALELPSGFPAMDIPADNPLTVEGVALGRYLFYEKRLSGNDHMSCNTCHTHSTAFTDGMAVSTGIDGVQGTRSAMALVNLGFLHFYFWDGRASTLEEQVLEPVRNPVEMHTTWPVVLAKLQADPAYPPLFRAAFGTPVVDSLLVAKAIAQFLRTLVSGNSAWDKWKRGEGTLSPDELAGYVLFTTEAGPPGEQVPLFGTDSTVTGQGGADCFHCHSEGLFTDGLFHNNALDAVPADSGRAGVTGLAQDLGKFRTPTLRNVVLTRPYMHDGRFHGLDQVLDHYNSGQTASATTDRFMKFTAEGSSMGLSPEQYAQIEAFLGSLADYDFVNNPAFLDPGPP